MMGKIPRLVNARGEEFLQNYLPDDVSAQECIETRVWHAPFSTRLPSKWFDISIFTEVQAGRGTEHDGVWVDFRGLVPEPIHKAEHYVIANRYRRRVVDVWREMAEMTLFVFAFNGGIRIRGDASTGVPGLFACGEASGGMHSADRLGGNAFASTQVFGRRAGLSAAHRNATTARSELDASQVAAELRALEGRLTFGAGGDLSSLRRKIGETMWRHAMICKSEKGLSECLGDLEAIRARDLPSAGPTRRDEVFNALDVHNLWQTAQIIASVSRERRESRGPHYRVDFPEPSPAHAGSYLIEPKRIPAPGEPLDLSMRLVNLTTQ